jgi:ABC-2 type transport system ATP-binding protein
MPSESQPFSTNVDAVRTTALVKDFGGKVAVDGLTLRVPRGTFFGFLGPNGAGQSTTIKMLTGLLAPTSGSIEILGIDFAARPVEVKRQIGVVPEDLALFDRLTGPEYLRFVAGMYNLPNTVASERADQLLHVMGLDSEPRKLVVDYSHGMKKKVSLAAALIHSPKLLFLDEPFEGVDAIAAKTMKDMLQTMIARGATIFLTSHVLDIVERLCTHLAIIDDGRLVAQGSIEELRAGVPVAGDGSRGRLTLEEIFVATVGGSTRPEQTLAWLAE